MFYDFYDNTVDFDVKMISPIASNAFQYYKYKLESTFFDESNHQINKIKVIPRRDKEPVLIWPVFSATARSAIVESSVSPERWLITEVYPLRVANCTAFIVSVREPI